MRKMKPYKQLNKQVFDLLLENLFYPYFTLDKHFGV